MSKHFLITKAFPLLAIALIYWLGSFNLPGIVFLPIALSIATIVFYITRKYGNTTEEKDKSGQNKK
jgi:hypothetical protein